MGVSNGANEVWPALWWNSDSFLISVPLLLWNGTTYYIGIIFLILTSSSLWDDGNGTPIPNAPLLPVGQGFFLLPSDNTTNTFAGAVAVNVGTSNNMASGKMVVPTLVAAAVPYGVLDHSTVATRAVV